jgi:hypothetical protein
MRQPRAAVPHHRADAGFGFHLLQFSVMRDDGDSVSSLDEDVVFSLRVAPVALTLSHFGLGVPTSVGCQGTANPYLLLELTLTIPADVAF